MNRKSLSLRLQDKELNAYLILLSVTLIGFWPLVTGHFSVKNDDIIYFLPYRYNIVESIRNGYFPLWNPYLYMGLPVSGDMQSGVWNPVVWLLTLTGRYTLTSLHAEILIYVFLGGLGIFKLLREIQFSKIVCYTIAISYMFSGYMLDSGQILSWISCACFLPYTYLYVIRLFKIPRLITCIQLAGSNYLLLVAGGYPFFFIANMYFLAVAFVVALIYIKKNDLPTGMMALKYTLLSFLLFSLVSAAPLLSFIDLLPYYSRGEYLSLKQALFNSYSPLSFLSMLFPFAVTRDHIDFGNNISISRNLYIGILLLPFIVTGIAGKRTLWWNTLLIIAVIASLLSLAQLFPFRKWAYWFLPLMNTFRHPANFRLFVTIALLLFAGKGLQEFLASPGITNKKRILNVFAVMLSGMLLTVIYYLPLKEPILFDFILFTPEGLKRILDQINFRQAIVVSFLVQLPFVVSGIVLLIKEKYKFLCFLSVLNVIVAGQPQLFTGTVGKNPTAAFNQFIKNQLAGFPLPDLTSTVPAPEENKRFLYEYKEPLGYFFNKKIAIITFLNNPTILNNYKAFINDSIVRTSAQQYPFAFAADSIVTVSKTVSNNKDHVQQFWLRSKKAMASVDNNSVLMTGFKPNEFKLTINSDTACFLVILQNNLPGWTARISNNMLPIQTINHTFMGIKIPRGSHQVEVRYKPAWFIPGMIISMAGIALALIFILISLRKNPVKI